MSILPKLEMSVVINKKDILVLLSEKKSSFKSVTNSYEKKCYKYN